MMDEASPADSSTIVSILHFWALNRNSLLIKGEHFLKYISAPCWTVEDTPIQIYACVLVELVIYSMQGYFLAFWSQKRHSSHG